MKFKHVLCWIRRDLRLQDHRALSEATHQAERVTLVFVFDATILTKLEDKDDKRVNFIHQSLEELGAALQAKGSSLVVRHGDPASEIPSLTKTLVADAVFCNRDYEPSAKTRDAAVEQALHKHGVAFQSFKDHVIFEGHEVLTQQKRPFQVFTPYKNAWLSRLDGRDELEYRADFARLTPAAQLEQHVQTIGMREIGFASSPLWLEAGERAAHARLKAFEKNIHLYHEARDFPAQSEGTSGLSVHLRFGTISIRELLRRSRAHRSPGAQTWLSELIWRDFFQAILDQFPEVATRTFRPEYNDLRWPGLPEHFDAWKTGKTGYPLVDAAMQHFATTGWMHNRLRMVVASFLVKDLLIDWRLGEAWFARKLLDFDLAANNGNWQWAASTGCDTQPYFRIFNPTTQSQRFDPRGEFIRQHLPELAHLTDKQIHLPRDPIVDHSLQRARALALYKK